MDAGEGRQNDGVGLRCAVMVVEDIDASAYDERCEER
jgi:hypothetical protein